MSHIFQVVVTDPHGIESVLIQCWDDEDEAEFWMDLIGDLDWGKYSSGIFRYRIAQSLGEFPALNKTPTDK